MDHGNQGCSKSAATGTLPESAASPNIAFARKWTPARWNSYLQKLKKEVQEGEAPIELYLHGVEILSSIQNPSWVCLHPDTEESHTKAPAIRLPNQRGTSSGPKNPESKQTYAAQEFMNHWSTGGWQWVFGAARFMQEYGPWLHHLAHQIAPKTTPSPNVTK